MVTMKLSTNSLVISLILSTVIDPTLALAEMSSPDDFSNRFQARPLYFYNPALIHHDWMNFTIDDFHDVLQCGETSIEASPIHEESTWTQLRQTYENIVVSTIQYFLHFS